MKRLYKKGYVDDGWFEEEESGMPAFFENKVYIQSVHCPLYTFLC